MDPGIGLLPGHSPNLASLQNALNDLDELAGALRSCSGNPERLPIEVLIGQGGNALERQELMEGLAELLRQRIEQGEGALASRLGEGFSIFDPSTRSPRSVGPSIEPDRRFEVIRRHAEGGLGTVSVAIDRELNREVALKQIRVEHANDSTRRDRFLIEAEITGGLEHPGIVPVYSLGHSADGQPYYAMRLIRGETLADAIARFHDKSLDGDRDGWGLELRLLLRRIVDVCNAIEYAHGRGILHRDLKPSNVMLGKHGETLVVDWGLAKPIRSLEGEEEEDEEGLLLPLAESGETLPGSAVGTPSFMSPEQAMGRRVSIGPRSDVYSLGATLYCLLTGSTPFRSKDPGRILQDVREGNFPRPRLVNPRVPRPLEAICLKAMALDPEARYESPRALADDIERWKADEPIQAFREPLAQKLGRWTRRRRTMVSATLAGLMVALIALGVILTVQSKANHELRDANQTEMRINRELLEANIRVARTNNELQAANLREQARFELALDAIRIFHNGVSDDLLLRETEFAGLRSRLLRGAIDFYRKLERQLETQPDRNSRQAIARVYSQVADLESTLGTGREILAAHRQALELRRKLASDQPEDHVARSEVASSLISLGMMVSKLENISTGLAHIEEARSILVELTRIAPDDRKFLGLLAQAEQEIGEILVRSKRNPEALAAYDRALRIQKRLASDEPDSLSQKDALATLTNRKGVLQIFQGQRPEALVTLNQTREILEKLIRSDPRNSRFQLELSNVLKDIGDLLSHSGKVDEALKLHQQALSIRESLSAALPSSVGYRVAISHSLLSIGSIHGLKGSKSKAIEAFRRSAALQEVQPPSSVGLFNLACTRSHLSHYLDGAESLVEADHAAQAFRRAIQLGFRDFSAIRSLSKFRPKLKASQEFRLLMMDLDFPGDPFESPVYPDSSTLTRR